MCGTLKECPRSRAWACDVSGATASRIGLGSSHWTQRPVNAMGEVRWRQLRNGAEGKLDARKGSALGKVLFCFFNLACSTHTHTHLFFSLENKCTRFRIQKMRFQCEKYSPPFPLASQSLLPTVEATSPVSYRFFQRYFMHEPVNTYVESFPAIGSTLHASSALDSFFSQLFPEQYIVSSFLFTAT